MCERSQRRRMPTGSSPADRAPESASQSRRSRSAMLCAWFVGIVAEPTGEKRILPFAFPLDTPGFHQPSRRGRRPQVPAAADRTRPCRRRRDPSNARSRRCRRRRRTSVAQGSLDFEIASSSRTGKSTTRASRSSRSSACSTCRRTHGDRTDSSTTPTTACRAGEWRSRSRRGSCAPIFRSLSANQQRTSAACRSAYRR